MFNNFYGNKSQKSKILLVLIGAIPGALIRWQINNDFWSNIVGTAFLGLLAGIKVNKRIKMLFVIGFCGSLTTFSGWMLTAFEKFLKGLFWEVVFVIGLTLIAGFIAFSAGFFLGKKLKR